MGGVNHDGVSLMGSIGTTIGAALAAPLTGGMSLLAIPLTQKPKIQSPSVPPVVKAPTTQDAAVQQAATEATARRNKGLGYSGTILSQMGGGSAGLKSTMGS